MADKAAPAPDEEVWWNGLRWVEAAHMQLVRFEDALYEDFQATADAEMRSRLNKDSEIGESWRESYDANYEPYDPSRPIRVPTWALHMQVSTELDLLAVAIRNVLRAKVRLPEPTRPDMTGEEVLELLRNVAEHWDEVGGRSANKLARDHADLAVGAYAMTGKEVWIGGAQGVPVSRIRSWLARVSVALTTSLTDAGVEVPADLMSSRVGGDDELPWPSDRLHYHWSIPTVSEQDWPRESMPPEIAELIALRFQRLRERDSHD